LKIPPFIVDRTGRCRNTFVYTFKKDFNEQSSPPNLGPSDTAPSGIFAGLRVRWPAPGLRQRLLYSFACTLSGAFSLSTSSDQSLPHPDALPGIRDKVQRTGYNHQ